LELDPPAQTGGFSVGAAACNLMVRRGTSLFCILLLLAGHLQAIVPASGTRMLSVGASCGVLLIRKEIEMRSTIIKFAMAALIAATAGYIGLSVSSAATKGGGKGPGTGPMTGMMDGTGPGMTGTMKAQ
jgi:hypothetical protein